jgi:hypothetical protein
MKSERLENVLFTFVLILSPVLWGFILGEYLKDKFDFEGLF